MKLLASLASPYTRKVRIFLAEKKIECDLDLVDVAPIDNAVNTHNPLGKIPTLVLDDGTRGDETLDEGSGPEGALTSEEREELRRLRRQVHTLEMERDFAKKAAAFFAKDLDRPTR